MMIATAFTVAPVRSEPPRIVPWLIRVVAAPGPPMSTPAALSAPAPLVSPPWIVPLLVSDAPCLSWTAFPAEPPASALPPEIVPLLTNDPLVIPAPMPPVPPTPLLAPPVIVPARVSGTALPVHLISPPPLAPESVKPWVSIVKLWVGAGNAVAPTWKLLPSTMVELASVDVSAVPIAARSSDSLLTTMTSADARRGNVPTMANARQENARRRS